MDGIIGSNYPVGNSIPEDKYYSRRYLGPAIDIVPDLTAKILKMNGEVIHQSTYCLLTAQELKNEEYLPRNFDKNIEEKLGSKSTVNDFDDMNMEEAPTFEMYGNNDGVEGTPDKTREELETNPDLSTDVY